ncbi:MAG: nitrilase-related carbon-nitrogen hydrolase [Kiloniellales bacterium]
MTESSETLTAALWATNLARPLADLADWAAGVERQLAAAKAEGASLLVLPEYMCEQWLSFAPPELKPSEEISWLAEQAPAALAAIAPLPACHDVALLAGTMAVQAERPLPGQPPQLNRAHLLLPDGRVISQDKLCLTPGERNPQAWNLGVGDEIAITEWNGLRVATLICLDIELPALSCLLAERDIDLLLVPSMTEKLSGHARVFSCAKARAVELLTTVLAVGCIGKAAASKPRLSNTSGAAAFVPCEAELGFVGVHAELPPSDRAKGPGPLLIARDLPLGAIRRLRRGGAEVWPGAWRSAHVKLREAGEAPRVAVARR